MPEFICAGNDGNLWFTDVGANAIGRISTSGGALEFPLTTQNATPFKIVSGPDENLWFTELTGNKVAKITTSGAVTEYTVDTSFSGSSSRRLTNSQRHFPAQVSVGQPPLPNALALSGAVATALESATNSSNGPEYITNGPDGALWFTYENYEAGRITTSGSLSYFSVSPVAQPAGITTARDGNLWFADDQDQNSTGTIARLQPTGQINEYEYAIGQQPYAFGIVSGPDGNLWFTDAGANAIGTLVY